MCVSSLMRKFGWADEMSARVWDLSSAHFSQELKLSCRQGNTGATVNCYSEMRREPAHRWSYDQQLFF